MIKQRILSLLKAFLFIVLITASVSFATTYIILKINLDQKIAQLDKSARLIAGQIKSANLNSILAFTDDFTIFIVHQRDGRVLFESIKRLGNEKDLWKQSKNKLITEMLQKKEGWLKFPKIEKWQLLSAQKTVRYLYLADLDWIVAVELPATVTATQLLAVYQPLVLGALVLFSLFLAFLAVSFRSRDDKFREEMIIEDETEPSYEPAVSNKLIEEAKKALSNTEEKEIKPEPLITSPPKVTTFVKKENEVLTDIKESENELEQKNVEAENKEKKTKELQKEKEVKDAHKEKTKEQKQKKSHSEIYFEKMMEQKKKTKKSKPDTIIGMAFTKKNNREKMDP